MAALSFGYAIPISGQYSRYTMNKEDEESMLSQLQETCQLISTKTSCQISISSDYNLSLTGTTQALMDARGHLLSTCPLEIKLTLTLSTLNNLSLDDHVEKLQQELSTKINIIPQQNHHHAFLTSDNPITIEIIGIPSQVELTRVRLLVLLDELLKNYTTDIVRLPLKLQYLICGRKRAGLLPIIEETCTNIYFPSPFLQDDKDTEPPIYITGEASHVSRVKDMLNKLAVQKAKSMYHKDTALYARKIDWLLLHRRDELRRIMHDNGAFIEFPLIGSGDDRVTVYAENRVNAERTLRALNFQACQIYEACFYFNNHDSSAIYDTTGAAAFFDSTSNLSNLVSELSQVSASEVIYKTDPGCIEVLGSERAIRNVYQRLQEMQFLQPFHQYTIFRVESSNEQRDFISGKKNGKINKIMKTSGAKIKFVPYINDYNFIIEVESTSFTKALDGLTLLQEELPAEISFYVPESYHKRIIGVGGKNIQRIMKKYGVYVKFSNTEEFASLGGYYNNEDNVVARTPMKNQINLDNLRHAVMELIHPKDRDYMIETLLIPFRLHTDLIHAYQNTFMTEELTKKTNTQVLWPDAELASNTVELLGPEAHIPVALKMIETIIPEEYQLHFPSTIPSHESLVQVIQDKLDMVVTYHPPLSEDTKDAYLSISLTRDKIMTSLKEALTIILDYFTEHQIALYDDKMTAETLFEEVEKGRTELKQSTLATSSSTNSNSSLLQANLLKPMTINSSHSGTTVKRRSDPYRKSPPQAYQFFNFSNEFHLDWQAKKPSSSDNHLRAIFDAPIDLTDQERTILHAYQRPTSATAANNFGGYDIWSTPTTQIANGNRRAAGGFPTTTTSPPKTYGHNTPTDSMRQRFNEGVFFPVGTEFNPYNSHDHSAASLKTSQSMPEPMLESHFNAGRHIIQQQQQQQQGFPIGYPTYSSTTRNTPPNDKPLFSNTTEDSQLQSMLESFSVSRRQPSNDQDDKGSRPPPGIDI